jgi:hypothetical protein
MDSNRLRRGATLALALALTLGACSGPPAANTGDPAGSVSAAFSAAQSGGIAKLSDFACAAHKNDIAKAFGGGDLSALSAAGIKPEDIAGAMTMSFENVTTKEVTKTDTEATVHVTSDVKMTIDQAKFKALMKTVMAAQGLPVDDATLDTMLTAMSAQLGKTTKLDEDVKVVKEDGKWLICE